MLTGLAMLALSPTSLPVDCASVGKSHTVAIGQGRKATVQFDGQQVSVTIDGKRSVLPVVSCEEEESTRARVRLLDANFDGLQDFAVYDLANLGWANDQYHLYLSQKNSPLLVKSRIDFIEANTVSLDAVSKTAEFSARFGASEAITTLCVKPDGRDLFRCRDSKPTNAGGGDLDFTWYALSGKPVLTRKAPAHPTTDSTSEAAYFTVLRKTYFAPQIGAAVGQAYVVQGDRVEVLRIHGEWAYARFTNRQGKVTAGWLPLRDLK